MKQRAVPEDPWVGINGLSFINPLVETNEFTLFTIEIASTLLLSAAKTIFSASWSQC
jgi:hypothetical protein